MAIYRILSFDGGGIRGLISAVWAEKLEKELKGPVRKYVDLLAGTSTGSILAAGLAVGMPAAEIANLYEQHGRQIFPSAPARLWKRFTRTFAQGPSAPKYSEEGLTAALKARFEERTLGSVPKKLALLVTSYDTFNRSAIMFKSTKADHKDLKLWEVVKASCSAPTYFPATKMRLDKGDAPLIDGGVVANNPTVCAIAEGVRRSTTDPAEAASNLDQFVVGSVGTGHTTRPISIEDAREWGALEWAVPIIDVLFDGAADAVDYIAGKLIARDRYFRLQTELNAAYDDMDNADATNLNALRNVARRFLEQEGGNELIAKLARALKDGR